MKVSIVEVGPRDGLQNVKESLSVEQKIALIQYLLDHGFIDIEAGSFVRPDKVPQMAHSDQIADHFAGQHDKLWYLVPNLKGLENALTHKVTQLAFFTAASETFNQKNIGMGIKESLQVIRDSINFLKESGYQFITGWENKPSMEKKLKLRLYVSTVISSPYEGKVKPDSTLKIMEELLPLGFSQVSLGDTIGVGVPNDWKALLAKIPSSYFKKNQIAMHCHDTYGTALSCVEFGLEQGVRTFDASIGGLGGCPFAPGATGNLATEDLLYFLEGQGIKTGIDVRSLLDAINPERTGTLKNVSKVGLALKEKH